MSLIIAGTVAAIAAKSGVAFRDDYLMGCDVLGAELEAPVKTQVTEVRTSNYWSTVAAGLTVAAVLSIIGYWNGGRQ